jgi:large subunit ribosomal protein L32e
MTKEETIKKFSEIPGVSKKTAEHLYDAGYHTVEKLKKATTSELEQIEHIGPKTAAAIVDGLKHVEKPAAKEEIKVVEKKKEKPAEKTKKAKEAAPEKLKVVEEKEAYVVKAKPELSDATAAALHLRKIQVSHRPSFNRDQIFRYKKLKHVWRNPSGVSTKQRRNYQYRPRQPAIGYGSPVAARGLHPSGFEEVLVHNAKDLTAIRPKTQAARIGGGVGARKRGVIEAEAKKLGIRVLNSRRAA